MVRSPVLYDILLVEDNAADAVIFQEALTAVMPSVTVFWVSNGDDALAFLKQKGKYPDAGKAKIVLLDLNMPGTGGLATLRDIRATPELSLTPVIVLSSSKARQDVESAYSSGANAFFTKLSSLDRFIDEVKVIVQHWLDFAELPLSKEAGR